MKNSNLAFYTIIALTATIPTYIWYNSMYNRESEVTSLYSTPSITTLYATKKECLIAELAKLTKGKKVTEKEKNTYLTKTGKLCKSFDTIPASTKNIQTNSPAHKGPSVQGDPLPKPIPTPPAENLPDFAPIAISTPEKGKVLISFKNLSGNHTKDIGVDYSVISWNGYDPYRGSITKSYTNEAVMNELGLGKPFGSTASNIFSKNGISFILPTQANSNIGLRTSANLINVCIDPANKIKESNETNNCKFQWTEKLYEGDIALESISYDKNKGFRLRSNITGDTDLDPDKTENLYALLKIDSDRTGIKADMKHELRHNSFKMSFVDIENEEIPELTKGKHTAYACIDAANILSETNETNNCKTVEFVVD